MAADKVPSIVISALSNNNERTVLSAILTSGTTTPPHYHTLFSETFALASGSLTLYTSPDGKEESLEAHELQIGESLTVPIGQLHTFKVGSTVTKITTTFEPGSLGFERAMLIMRGTQRDGTYQEFGVATEDNILFLAVLSELTNTNQVGAVKAHMDELYRTKGDEIAAKKEELLEKYATEEQLKRGTEDY
jgi:quercetin dioxygenase-like cupin family protein